jgi:putative transposase
LDKAFEGFFRRCKTDEKAGFPRFRGMHRYNSFCYPQSGFAVIGREVKLSKIGNIRIKMHRLLEGEIKTCTLRKNTTGEWDISFSCEVEANLLSSNEKSVGIDVGLRQFAVLSNGQEIPNPRFFQKGQKALAKAQKNSPKQRKGLKSAGREEK